MEGDFDEAVQENRIHSKFNSGDFVLSHHDRAGACDADDDDDSAVEDFEVVERNSTSSSLAEEKFAKIDRFLRSLKEFLAAHNDSSTSTDLKALLEKGKENGGSLIQRLEQAVEEGKKKMRREKPAVSPASAFDSKLDFNQQKRKSSQKVEESKLLKKATVKLHSPSPQKAGTLELIDAVLGLARNISTGAVHIIPQGDSARNATSEARPSNASSSATADTVSNSTVCSLFNTYTPFQEAHFSDPNIHHMASTNFTIPEEVKAQINAEREKIDSVYANFTLGTNATAVDELVKKVEEAESRLRSKMEKFAGNSSIVLGNLHDGEGSSKDARSEIANQQSLYGSIQGNGDVHGLMIRRWENSVERPSKVL